MNRSSAIAVICLLAIAGSAAWLVLRPKSPAAKAKEAAEWRKCFECGHEWRKDQHALILESKEAPPGYRFAAQCPKCKAWAGLSLIKCEKCGKTCTTRIIVKNDDGTISVPKRHVCPSCGAPLGASRAEGPPEEASE
jgi:hypothetical protein